MSDRRLPSADTHPRFGTGANISCGLLFVLAGKLADKGVSFLPVIQHCYSHDEPAMENFSVILFRKPSIAVPEYHGIIFLLKPVLSSVDRILLLLALRKDNLDGLVACYCQILPAYLEGYTFQELQEVSDLAMQNSRVRERFVRCQSGNIAVQIDNQVRCGTEARLQVVIISAKDGIAGIHRRRWMGKVLS
jgi:hypothetical protein